MKKNSDEDGDYVHPDDSDTDSEMEERNKKKKEADDVDRVAFFRGHQVLHGSILHDIEEPQMRSLVRKVEDQWWLELFTNSSKALFEKEVNEFYTNCRVTARRVFFVVKGTKIEFGREELGVVLGIPAEGCCRYVKMKWPKRTDGISHVSVIRKFASNLRIRRE